MNIIKFEEVANKIIEIKGEKVILDSDVAELYGVETKEINQAVSNNPDKFLENYVFEFSKEEKAEVVKNFDHLTKIKFSPYLPKAFTEKGLYMLATILKGPKATQTTITIIEAFAKLRPPKEMRLPKDIFVIAADIDYSEKRENIFHYGIELNPIKTLSLRAGFDRETPTVGIGINAENLDLDYAFLSHPELNLSHRISFAFKFGKSKEEAEEELMFREQKQAEINSLLEKGQISLENKDWSAAVENFKKVLTLDKENKEAKEKLAYGENNLKAIGLHLKNGQEFLTNREWDKAIAEFEQVLTLDPKNQEAITQKKRAEEEKIKRAKGLNIAVAEFEARNVSQMDAVTTSDLLRSELVKSAAFNVIDRRNMEKILAEQRFEMTGCTTQECAVQMGRLLNVEKVIAGTLSKLMDTFYVIVNVVDVETGKIEFSEQVKAVTSDEIVSACQTISQTIVQKYK